MPLCPSLLALWAARALVRIMMPAAEAGRELLRTPLRRSSQNPTRAQLRRGLQDSLQPSRPLVGETVGQSRITSQLAHEELVVLVDVLLEVVVDLRSRLGGVDYPSELQYAPIVVLFLYCFGQARVVLVGIHQPVFDDVCRNVLTSCLSRISPKILPYPGNPRHHCTWRSPTSMPRWRFGEPPQDELLRIPLPRTPVNKGVQEKRPRLLETLTL